MVLAGPAAAGGRPDRAGYARDRRGSRLSRPRGSASALVRSASAGEIDERGDRGPRGHGGVWTGSPPSSRKPRPQPLVAGVAASALPGPRGRGARRVARRPARWYAALPGSRRSRNQRRRWAKESGSAPPGRRRHRQHRRGRGPGPAAIRRASAARGALEDGAERQLDVERCAQPRHQPGGEQRVAAQREEVVATPHPLDAEDLGRSAPPARSSTGARWADAGRRRRRGPGRAGVGQGRAGRPCRWATAAGRPAARRPPAPCSSGRLARRNARSSARSAAPRGVT